VGAAEQGEGAADVVASASERDGGGEDEGAKGTGEGTGEEEGDPSGGEDRESYGGGGAETEDVMFSANRAGDMDAEGDPEQEEEFVEECLIAEGAEGEEVGELVEKDPDGERKESFQEGTEVHSSAEGLGGFQIGRRDRQEDERKDEAPAKGGSDHPPHPEDHGPIRKQADRCRRRVTHHMDRLRAS